MILHDYFKSPQWLPFTSEKSVITLCIWNVNPMFNNKNNWYLGRALTAEGMLFHLSYSYVAGRRELTSEWFVGEDWECGFLGLAGDPKMAI